ncbi:MAG: hypothetical protein JSR60_18615 [Proteobacteria bacterium]|nr:hypothetical protein [Pseudomonadota bacterium]
MRKPAPVTYFFGNPVVVIGLIIATIYFAYQWWANSWSPLTPLLALLAASYGTKASDEISKYNRWKREWEALE